MGNKSVEKSPLRFSFFQNVLYFRALAYIMDADWRLQSDGVANSRLQDNTGPHSYETAKQILQTAQTSYPNATVRTSDGFDDFIRKITPFEDTLPVIDYEIGDSWVFGSSADPIKAASYRAVIRARKQCVEDGLWEADAVAERTFDRLMLKLGEHTWGSSGANCKTLPFDNPSFRVRARSAPAPRTWLPVVYVAHLFPTLFLLLLLCCSRHSKVTVAVVVAFVSRPPSGPCMPTRSTSVPPPGRPRGRSRWRPTRPRRTVRTSTRTA